MFWRIKEEKGDGKFGVSVIGDAAGRLDFLFAQDFAEGCVALGAFKETDFKLHAFALFVWPSSHFPGFLGLRDFCCAFWTFRHFFLFPPLCALFHGFS